MSYVSAIEGHAAAARTVAGHDSSHGNTILVPDAELLTTAHYRHVGPDLVLTGHDGREFTIPGYFSTEHHLGLAAPDGESLSADLVDLLAGSLTPGQYAQAQPTNPADSIGKVEKVVGSVTVVRNGVSVALNVGDAVYKSDLIETGTSSTCGIGFPDGSALNLVANTRMALSDYSFDPSSNSNNALFSLVDGTFAFVAGKVAHSGDMKISTPVATMGIRGTTGYGEKGDHTYLFVVVDDYATTHHGAYDLFQLDSNGNILRDQNGLPILLTTVSQTEFVTECSTTSCSTTPMSAAQQDFTQQITSQLFETYMLNNPQPQSNPGGNGSSTPQFNQPDGQRNLELIRIDIPLNINSSNSNNVPTLPPISVLVIPILSSPPLVSSPAGGWTSDTLIEHYLFPTIDATYFTSSKFVVPASGIEANPDLGGAFAISVDANSITVAQFAFSGTFTHTSFNGFEVSDLTENPEISGFSIDPITNLVGLTTADIIFDSNTIWVNWTGLTFQTGTIVKIDLTFDPPLNPSEVSIAQTLDGSLSPITNASTLTVVDGTELVLLGGIENTGVIAVDGAEAPTAIGVNGTVTLSGGGHIELSDSAQNYFIGDGMLNNVDNTISGAGDIGNGSLTLHNEGLIEAQGSHALIIDTGANTIINTGILEANGDSLIVDSPVSGGGNAVIAGGVLEFAAASDNNVSFSGGETGVLALDHSLEFTGHISGFGGSDQIDLGDIAYSAATSLNYAADAGNTGGLMTVSDGGTAANIAMLGSFTASSFALSSDGHGGTLITEAAPTNQTADGDATGGVGANGTITAADTDASNTQTASFTPDGSSYSGNFSLGAVSENDGSVSVDWNFSLANDQIQLGTAQIVNQSYDVSVADAHNPALNVNQTVSVAIGGPGNDNFVFAPGIGAETIANFNPQNDTIQLNGFTDAQSQQQLASLISNDAHGDAVINLGHNDSITLPGMSPAELHAVLQSAVHLH